MPDALTSAFAEDPVKQAQWRAFLDRARVEQRPPLDQVVADLHRRLWSLLEARPG